MVRYQRLLPKLWRVPIMVIIVTHKYISLTLNCLHPNHLSSSFTTFSQKLPVNPNLTSPR